MVQKYILPAAALKNMLISCDAHRKTAIFFSFSDVVVQIVDARNPLLFRCPDLVRTELVQWEMGCVHC